VGYEINQDSALPGTQGEDGDLIGAKQFYAQFMKLVEGKNISIVTQSMAKQQQNNPQFNKQPNEEDMSLNE
jgi:hypothetical protein